MITSSTVHNPTEPVTPRDFRNVITYCLRCGAIVSWDRRGTPAVVRFGDRHILICLEEGCALHVEEFPRGIQYLDGTFLGLLDQPTSC